MNAYYNEALRRVRNVPGLEAAGLTDNLPLGTNRTWGVGAVGHTYKPAEYPEAFVRIVSDDYIKAMGIRIIQGRDLAPTDDEKSQRVILVNQSLARALCPGEDAVGKLMQVDDPKKPRQIVGIVEECGIWHWKQAPAMRCICRFARAEIHSSVTWWFAVRKTIRNWPEAFGPRLLPLDPGLPNERFKTLSEIVDGAVSPRRFISRATVRLRHLRFDFGVARDLRRHLVFGQSADR